MKSNKSKKMAHKIKLARMVKRRMKVVVVVHESQEWRALNRTATGGCSWVGSRLVTAREEGSEGVLRWPPLEENKTIWPAAGCEENEAAAAAVGEERRRD